MSKRLVQGIGLNDAGYKVYEYEDTRDLQPNGKKKQKIVWTCPYYEKWSSMLKRAYSIACHKKQPTYIGCSVCKEWLTFSNFRKWMVTQDWEGMHLDKDFLIEGNKVYSPETCVFIYGIINTFIKESGGTRSGALVGCTPYREKYKSRCRNPFKKDGDTRTRYIGIYVTELSAHLAWKYRKYIYAVELTNSDYVTDDRIKQVLLNKYKNYTIVEDHLK